MANIQKPFFTISLDFELFWGVFDVKKISQYANNILGGRAAIPLMLSLFREYNIHATWATVGMASFQNKKQLLQYIPEITPQYPNTKMDPYLHLKFVGETEDDDPYHFGYSLLCEIMAVQGMEIGSHSFSHFYCMEQDNPEAFRQDLRASVDALGRLGILPSSMVFCRNQYTDVDLKTCREIGFDCFRGNEKNFFYKSRRTEQPLTIRAARLIDSYVNLSGNHVCNPFETRIQGLINIPSSRFLRPWVNKTYLQELFLKRILLAMTDSAMRGIGFHLWWHPHNFGQNLNQNISTLQTILDHYRKLNEDYGMESLNMKEVSARFSNKK